MDKRFIILYGYGYSGSGAVLDLLKEFDNVEVNSSFFSIIKDPYGIIDLENALTENWEQVKAATALLDFLWLCKKSERTNKNYLSPPGLNLKNTLNNNFLQYSQEFVSSLIEFDYLNWNEITDFKLGYFENIYYRFARILSRKGIIPQPRIDRIPFCYTTHENYYRHVREYINKLFEGYNNESFIVIDHHPLPIQYGDLLNSYFGENAKMIVVDRDPRSIYYDLVRHKNRVGLELANSQNPDIYIKWHNALRRKRPISQNILYLQFEDLIYDYDNQVDRIISFSGLSKENHKFKRQFFNPDISVKNIDIWNTSDIGIPKNVFEILNSSLGGKTQ